MAIGDGECLHLEMVLPEYTHFVIEGLINIVGLNPEGVVEFMISQWISTNFAQLQSAELSFRDFQKRVKDKP